MGERIICLSSRYPGPVRRHGAGRSGVPYLALHPMGFPVPPRLRLERWALTPPFHPYPALPGTCRQRRFEEGLGGIFSVVLSVGTPYGIASRVYPHSSGLRWSRGLRGIAPFGVRTFLPPGQAGRAILRPSKTKEKLLEGMEDARGGWKGEVRSPKPEARR
jgi:hypothetical protein